MKNKSTLNLWSYGFRHGLPLEVVLKRMKETVQQTGIDQLPERERRYWEYTRLCLQRMNKWLKIYTPAAHHLQVVSAIEEPLLFLVISEDWCGDAAQSIPCIYKLIQSNPRLQLRFLDRDAHPEVMDRFLTDGKRKIPIVVAINEQGEAIFRWGPRPAPAEAIFKAGNSLGKPHQEVLQDIHAWYARDRCQSTAEEITRLILQYGLSPYQPSSAVDA